MLFDSGAGQNNHIIDSQADTPKARCGFGSVTYVLPVEGRDVLAIVGTLHGQKGVTPQ